MYYDVVQNPHNHPQTCRFGYNTFMLDKTLRALWLTPHS